MFFTFIRLVLLYRTITFSLTFNFEFWLISLFTKLVVKLLLSTKYFATFIGDFLTFIHTTRLLMNYLQLLICELVVFIPLSALWILRVFSCELLLEVLLRVSTSLFLFRASYNLNWLSIIVLIIVRSLIFRAFLYLNYSSILNLLWTIISIFQDLSLVFLGFTSIVCLSLWTWPDWAEESLKGIHCFCINVKYLVFNWLYIH